MDETTKKLVAEIRAKYNSINTYIATFKSNVEHVMLSGNSTGRLYYRHPDSVRVEKNSNGKNSVEVHFQNKVSRFVEGERIVYQYDLSEVKIPQQFRFIDSFPRVNDPFGVIDTESLKYHGVAAVEGISVYTFSGDIKHEFETFGRKYTLDIQINTKVSSETGLMLEYEMTTKALGVTSRSHSAFHVLETNGDIDESLFVINMGGKEIRHADITDMLNDGMNPFDRDVGASNN